MPERLEFDFLRTTRELEEFRPSWDELWNGDCNATPFQSAGWLIPWWHQFGKAELRAMIVSREGKPIAFLPFHIYCDPIRNERQLLLLGAGTTDYLDGVFSPECKIQHVQMILDRLRGADGWDVLYAVQLRQKSLLFQALNQMSDSDAQAFKGESCSRMRALPIEELPGRMRGNAIYYRNRAMRLGNLELEIADKHNWPALFDILVNLHTSRWENKGESGVLADPRVLACHREAVPALQERGLLRLSALRLNGEAIAIAYHLVDPPARRERTQYPYLIAHSMKYAELRPGTVLLALMTDRAAKQGVEYIDMLRGEESYKKLWHVEPVPTFGFAIHHSMERRRLRSA